jgi:tetratricopeptide (TPR) repeat protein
MPYGACISAVPRSLRKKGGNMHCRLYPIRRLFLPILVACCWNLPAAADDLTDANSLYQARQLPEALGRTDVALKRTPRDAQMRFLKGLILTDMGKRTEAIAVFSALTVDFPSMPEPYNNLAVLYAADGQHDSARVALEKAIQANPNFTKAYENLADIYLTLASARYGTLLQQDPDNTQVRFKYLLVRSALDNPGESLPNAPATKPIAGKAALPPVLQSASAPASQSSDSERAAVLAAVNAWADAWSSQDLPRYLGFYATGFRVPNGKTRAEWTQQRRTRIVKADRIEVTVEAPEVTVRGKSATVRFLQHYVSGKRNSRERKTLVMQNQDGQWKIVQERGA